MTKLVKIRASVFIGHVLWLDPVIDPKQQLKISFQGDGRGFEPHAARTGRSRVEQEVTVDFEKQRMVTYADTGVTVMKTLALDGSIQYEQEKASPHQVQVVNEQWLEDEVCFRMQASASNPLRKEAPAVDYAVDVKVHRSGLVALEGRHDGFPCFEFYKQLDYGPYEVLYQHDYLAAGSTPASMAGDMEYSFTVAK